MQLKVIKADTSQEEYLHTKVLGTITNALAHLGQDSSFVAEQLCEAITFYLYNKHTDGVVSSSEIYFMVQAMLTATGHEQASIALNNYHFTRELARRRIEVICQNDPAYRRNWNKSQISQDLCVGKKLERHLARAIASCVEEKVIRLGMLRIPKKLVKQLVEIETQAILCAHRQLAECEKDRRRKNPAENISGQETTTELCSIAV